MWTEIRPAVEMPRLFERGADVVSFAGGLPDLDVLPLETVSAQLSRLVRLGGRLALQYTTPHVAGALVPAIDDLMAREGSSAVADRLVPTGGSQMGLMAVGLALASPGTPSSSRPPPTPAPPPPSAPPAWTSTPHPRTARESTRRLCGRRSPGCARTAGRYGCCTATPPSRTRPAPPCPSSAAAPCSPRPASWTSSSSRTTPTACSASTGTPPPPCTPSIPTGSSTSAPSPRCSHRACAAAGSPRPSRWCRPCATPPR